MDKQNENRPDGNPSIRDEANALVACAFRNGPLEDLHAGKYSDILDDSSYSRITDDEMKQLMINARETLARLLTLREESPDEYACWVKEYGERYCYNWER